MEPLAKAAGTYRLIITRRDASEIFLLPNGRGWALPQAQIDLQQRLAEQLTAWVMSAWKLEVYCLLIPNAQEKPLSAPTKCALLELVKHHGNSPAGIYWMPRTVAMRCCGLSDAAAITQSIEQLDAYAKGQIAGHFACRGWLRELFRWSQEQIAPQYRRLTGAFCQLNASPTFSLIRFETDTGAVWFKATGEPNSHELAVTVALTRLFPRYLPRLLGVHHAWNGWLSEEAAGHPLAQMAGVAPWEQAAEQLGELQISSIGETAELLAARSRDLRITTLAERIDPFLVRMNELMAAQQKQTPAPLDRSELAVVAARLKRSCAVLEDFELPDTIGHFDLNPGNILVSEERCVFLDWSEACVTNPLTTFEYLRQYMRRSRVEESGAGERITTAYLRPWTRLYSSTVLTRALAFAPLIAVFAYAVASDSWRSVDATSEPGLAGYYRGLARRMYREAIEVPGRNN